MVNTNMHLQVFNFTLFSAVDIAVETSVDDGSVVACLCAVSAVVGGLLTTDAARLPRHGA